MKTQAVVPVEEYLATTYSPDREYLDGVLLERNLGEKDHSRTQLVLGALFLAMESKLPIKAYSDQRVQVRPERYRVPDLCVVEQSQRQGQIFAAPPFLCVEILSKDDSLMSLQERIDDFLAFGVSYVWVIDPKNKRGWAYTKESITEAKDGILRTANPEIAVRLAEICPAED
jgi:Uma2 family endonuclease